MCVPRVGSVLLETLLLEVDTYVFAYTRFLQ